MCEILRGYTAGLLENSGGQHGGARGGGWLAVAARVGTYRGGYTAGDRRAIEAGLLHGRALQGVVCTNALELGIDIGDLDAVVTLGYPGSLASLQQQFGRAGRRGGQSLGIMVCYDTPVDAYFVRHPDRLFPEATTAQSMPDEEVRRRLTEQASFGVSGRNGTTINPYLLQSHLICAAAELPLRLQSNGPSRLFGENVVCTSLLEGDEVDAALFGGSTMLREAMDTGASSIGLLGRSSALLFGAQMHSVPPFLCVGTSHHESRGDTESWSANPALWIGGSMGGPHGAVSMRSIGATYSVISTHTKQEFETVEETKAFFSLFVGSLYEHQSTLYRVVDLNIAARLAYAEPLPPPRPNYITQPCHSTKLDICRQDEHQVFNKGLEMHFGRLLVTVQVCLWGGQ